MDLTENERSLIEERRRNEAGEKETEKQAEAEREAHRARQKRIDDATAPVVRLVLKLMKKAQPVDINNLLHQVAKRIEEKRPDVMEWNRRRSEEASEGRAREEREASASRREASEREEERLTGKRPKHQSDD